MGRPFKGMGDFYIPAAKLKSTLGGTVSTLDTETLQKLLGGVTAAEVEAELAADRERFDGAAEVADALRRSVRLGLALRRWIERGKLAAFTFNFLDMRKSAGHLTVPFLEASKAMARGTGYAGEGDVLTALLVGAVAAGNEQTTFTEMFCPNWEDGTVYLSHMGEVNWRLLEGRGLLREMDYKYSATDNPALVTGRFRPGEIVLVNLAPVTESGYRLILAPATMLPVTGTDKMEGSVRGWFRPRLALPDFLSAYSRLGGTHHLAMTYAESTETLETFARLSGWETVVIQ